MPQSMIPRDSWVFGNFTYMGKTAYGKFLDGDGQATDILNELAIQG